MDPDQTPTSNLQATPLAPPKSVAQMPVPPEQNPKPDNPSLTMLDSLEYALMFISMYVLGSTIGMFLHYYVDKFFPPINVSDESYSIFTWIFALGSGDSYGSGGILPVLSASLIVTFPLFAFFFIHTAKRASQHPEIKHLKLRKGLIYNTLVITFLFMLYKMISLVYGSLTGNFSPNFILHFLVTIGINALIFFYFFYEVKTEKRE
ncbi:MAG: hypothetical protein ACD_37C00160G0005 [uncultured bacterium]|nr:MAG: hypothetical protein ACD_37C00160G0005 [uncultured bacterium]